MEKSPPDQLEKSTMANDDAAAKLRTFACILKLEHDLFNLAEFDDAAAIAVNNSKMLLDFRSAALFKRDGNKFSLLAQYGIPEKNSRSKFIMQQQEMLQKLPLDGDYQTVAGEGDNIYAVWKLPRPVSVPAGAPEFILSAEYEKEVPSFVQAVGKVLLGVIANALYFYCLPRRKLWKNRKFSGKLFFWLLLCAGIAALMFVRVPESVTAEFTLRPEKNTIVYAKFDGSVSECLKKDGERVTAGEVIARYDTGLLQYRLEQAQNSLAELDAQIVLEEHNSFTEPEKLGKVQMLRARRDVLAVTVREAQWFLHNAEIISPVTGILILADGTADKLAGRALRTGDKVFEIYHGDGIAVEIPVDEHDASILQNDFSVTAFLYTAPDEGIAVDVDSVAVYPELTEQKTYCYTVRGKLSGDTQNLKYGMRGVAKLYGGEVFLGYRLFKSMVLYFRGL